MARITRCREPGCGRRIELVMLWSLDEVPRKGQPRKMMPIDLDEYAGDDVRATVAVSGIEHRRGRVLKAGEEPLFDEERRMTHFATCEARKRTRDQQRALAAAQAAGADNVVPFRRPPGLTPRPK
jgi:hypothetical protein